MAPAIDLVHGVLVGQSKGLDPSSSFDFRQRARFVGFPKDNPVDAVRETFA
jgi:hypothetical protein